MNPWLKRLYDVSPVAVQNVLLSAFSARLERQRYGGRFREFRSLLEESEYWDVARMRAWQEERLRHIVRHAYATVPYYRELFDLHGIRPDHFSGLDDLQKVPVLTRDIVKRRLKDLVSTAYPPSKRVEGHTSGTTGSPLTLFYSPDMMAMNYAVFDRQYRWAGIRMERNGDRIAMLRGNVVVPLKQSRPPFWRFNRRLNQLYLSSFHLKPDNMPFYFEALRTFRPKVLDGYPSSVYVVAKSLLNRNERIPLHAVITSSETLYDFQREAIEKAFECRVFDYYAAAERVVFSVECERHEGHHLCEEYGITELLDESGNPVSPGTEGYVVGTTLHNEAMPLIRYQMSDRGAMKIKACSCGRPLPLMEDITTKAEDMLRLRDGRMIPPSVLTHPFKPLDCIEASQLIQTDVDRLLIRLVPRPDYNDRYGETLTRELKARLGDDMRIDIELTDALERTSSGKFKWVISHVGLEL